MLFSLLFKIAEMYCHPKKMTGGRFENVFLSLQQMVAHDLMNIPHKNQSTKLGRLKLQNNVLLK